MVRLNAADWPITRSWSATMLRPTPRLKSPQLRVRMWCANRIGRLPVRATRRPRHHPVRASSGSTRTRFSRPRFSVAPARPSSRGSIAAVVPRWNSRVRNWAGAHGARSMHGIGSRARAVWRPVRIFFPGARDGPRPAASTRRCTRARKSDFRGSSSAGAARAACSSGCSDMRCHRPRARSANSPCGRRSGSWLCARGPAIWGGATAARSGMRGAKELRVER